MTDDAIERARLAVQAAREGDAVAAQEHLERARKQARVTARRHRQLVEIVALVVGGHADRAAGLAFEHLAEHPEDAELLAHLTIAP